ncbi:MAG: hypothetical protein IH840_00120 [Candidatus Heimdallarchaeota archaeon]|nr:hypothetical protein [Candidatus Heimdallarchaeota archaeon]
MTAESTTLERESSTTQTNMAIKSLMEDVGILREEGFLNGESLSVGLIKEFGTDFFSENKQESELRIVLSRYPKIVKTINNLRIIHKTRLIDAYGYHQTQVKAVLDTLELLGLVTMITYTGKSRKQNVLFPYLTRDCSDNDVQQYMKAFLKKDGAWFEKQEQRDEPKKKSTPQDVVNFGIEVSELSKEARDSKDPEINEQAAAFILSEEFQDLKRAQEQVEEQLESNKLTERQYAPLLHRLQVKYAKLLVKHGSRTKRLVKIMNEQYPALNATLALKLIEVRDEGKP